MAISEIPVLLFTYKRLNCLKETIIALQNNFLASDTELIIFSDGPKSDKDKEKIDLVNEYLNKITGFKKITLHRSDVNKGLARSIISGVTMVLKDHEAVIVLEDDLVTSPNFLNFMNQALDYYKSNQEVYSISGYTSPITQPPGYQPDVYFHQRGCSWGWATWKSRWEAIDWNLLNRVSSDDLHKTKALGSDFPSLVQKYKRSTIDSWAVPWGYYEFVNGMTTVFPTVSKVRNVGFDGEATHTANSQKRFDTYLDESGMSTFSFEEKVRYHHHYLKQFAKKFSYFQRLKWRLIHDLEKIVR